MSNSNYGLVSNQLANQALVHRPKVGSRSAQQLLQDELNELISLAASSRKLAKEAREDAAGFDVDAEKLIPRIAELQAALERIGETT